MPSSSLKIISGEANKPFTQQICSHLGVALTRTEKISFSNENMLVRILDNVRESDVFVIQTSTPPVHENLMELLLLLDALKYASAKRITAVLPYFPYVRSDKKDQPRISIAAKLIAKLLQTAGADRVLTMDLHAPQIQGFFDIVSDQLLATEVICNYFKQMDLSNTVLVAADIGEAKALGPYANQLNVPVAIIDKRRIGNTDTVEFRNLIGEVEGKNCLLIDDEIASGGTVCNASVFLKKKNAKSINVAAVHPVLSGDAIQSICEAPIDKVIVTDTIPLTQKAIDSQKILQLPVAPLFAKAIERIHTGDSISVLF